MEEDKERKRRWCVCVYGGVRVGLEVEESGGYDDGQTWGSPPSIKTAGM